MQLTGRFHGKWSHLNPMSNGLALQLLQLRRFGMCQGALDFPVNQITSSGIFFFGPGFFFPNWFLEAGNLNRDSLMFRQIDRL